MQRTSFWIVYAFFAPENQGPEELLLSDETADFANMDTGDYVLANHSSVFKALPVQRTAVSGQLSLSGNKVWKTRLLLLS